MMRSITTYLIMILSVGIIISGVQSQTIAPASRVTYDNSISIKKLCDDQIALSKNRFSAKKNFSTQPQQILGAKLIATMANAYATINQTTNQTAFDPYSNTVVVVYRGTDVDGTTGGNELNYIWSSDQGTTWSADIKKINIGTENQTGKLRARYPNAILANLTKSPNRTDARMVAMWPQLNASWSEIRWASAPIGSMPSDKGNMPKPPSGADWFIPEHPFIDQSNGTIYATSATFDNSASPAQVVYEYYCMKSTDAGKTWTILPNPVFPDLLEKTPIDVAGDVSPDGKTINIACMGVTLASNGGYNVFASDHKLGFTKSTDGGMNWSTPEFLSIDDAQNMNVTITPNPTVYATVDMVTDANGDPHFLTAISGDLFYPLDSTYVVEVTRKASGPWKMYKVANIVQPWIPRFGNPLNATGSQQPIQHIMSEVGWARSTDGNKIFAKWIDCDSSLKFVPIRNVYMRDSIHNIWASARDIRSNTWNAGWLTPTKITNTPTIDEKQTKMAILVGSDNHLNITYTIWATGDNPDDDDLGQAQVYFVTSIDGSGAPVSLNPLVSVKDQTKDIPKHYTLKQNYPNPFSAGRGSSRSFGISPTNISFSLPTADRVKIRVFDLLGKEIATVTNENYEAGEHQVTFDASELPSGIYIYRMESGSFTATRKMTVL